MRGRNYRTWLRQPCFVVSCKGADFDAISAAYEKFSCVLDQTYPFFTPSICKSIHHMPGTPSMSHREAFFPREPIGSHCNTKK